MKMVVTLEEKKKNKYLYVKYYIGKYYTSFVLANFFCPNHLLINKTCKDLSFEVC